eukprot:TRINITY_DN1159_c0_g2_i3.p1 TRINITY_DN1159_c0_g2~~TRINITY_DN1159_c0_g2_i3.p1  ORF type:complete len:842 (+),score=201.85 TRINITY_DN1159_c0_g2_i3:199-2724(+)
MSNEDGGTQWATPEADGDWGAAASQSAPELMSVEDPSATFWATPASQLPADGTPAESPGGFVPPELNAGIPAETAPDWGGESQQQHPVATQEASAASPKPDEAAATAAPAPAPAGGSAVCALRIEGSLGASGIYFRCGEHSGQPMFQLLSDQETSGLVGDTGVLFLYYWDTCGDIASAGWYAAQNPTTLTDEYEEFWAVLGSPPLPGESESGARMVAVDRRAPEVVDRLSRLPAVLRAELEAIAAAAEEAASQAMPGSMASDSSLVRTSLGSTQAADENDLMAAAANASGGAPGSTDEASCQDAPAPAAVAEEPTSPPAPADAAAAAAPAAAPAAAGVVGSSPPLIESSGDPIEEDSEIADPIEDPDREEPGAAADPTLQLLLDLASGGNREESGEPRDALEPDEESSLPAFAFEREVAAEETPQRSDAAVAGGSEEAGGGGAGDSSLGAAGQSHAEDGQGGPFSPTAFSPPAVGNTATGGAAEAVVVPPMREEEVAAAAAAAAAEETPEAGGDAAGEPPHAPESPHLDASSQVIADETTRAEVRPEPPQPLLRAHQAISSTQARSNLLRRRRPSFMRWLHGGIASARSLAFGSAGASAASQRAAPVQRVPAPAVATAAPSAEPPRAPEVSTNRVVEDLRILREAGGGGGGAARAEGHAKEAHAVSGADGTLQLENTQSTQSPGLYGGDECSEEIREELEIVREIVGWLLEYIYQRYVGPEKAASVPALMERYVRGETWLLETVARKHIARDRDNLPAASNHALVLEYGELVQVVRTRFAGGNKRFEPTRIGRTLSEQFVLQICAVIQDVIELRRANLRARPRPLDSFMEREAKRRRRATI